jgi:hypothetical protein
MVNGVACTDPLLGNDGETNNETTPVVRQQFLDKQQLNNNEERCFLRGPCQCVINGTCLELSQLWNTRQPLRTLAEYIVRISYQETTSEDRTFYMCCSYSDLYSV